MLGSGVSQGKALVFINMAPLLGMGNLRTFVTIIVLVQFCDVSMALRANPRDGAFVGYSEKVSGAVVVSFTCAMSCVIHH